MDRDTCRNNDEMEGVHHHHHHRSEETWNSTTLEVPNDDGGIRLRRGKQRRVVTGGVSCFHPRLLVSRPTGGTFVGNGSTDENGAVATSRQRTQQGRPDQDNQFPSLLPYFLVRDKTKHSWNWHRLLLLQTLLGHCCLSCLRSSLVPYCCYLEILLLLFWDGSTMTTPKRNSILGVAV